MGGCAICSVFAERMQQLILLSKTSGFFMYHFEAFKNYCRKPLTWLVWELLTENDDNVICDRTCMWFFVTVLVTSPMYGYTFKLQHIKHASLSLSQICEPHRTESVQMEFCHYSVWQNCTICYKDLSFFCWFLSKILWNELAVLHADFKLHWRLENVSSALFIQCLCVR